MKNLFKIIIYIFLFSFINNCEKSNPTSSEIAVQQDSLQVLNYSWKIKNGMIESEDSISVLFNKKVSIKRINSNISYCLAEIEAEYTSNHHGFSFAFSCAKLGGDYSFDINVQDSTGDTKDFHIDVPLYTKKHALEGRILNYYLNDDKNTIWILTETPNTITLLNYPDLTLKYQIPLDFAPTKMVINPYNKYAYVLCNDYGIDNQDNYYYSYIYIINIDNGELIKKIHLDADEKDHPQHPNVYPYDIGFTKSGYGIFLQGVKGTSALRWKVIDSARDDTIHVHELYGFDNDQYPYFRKIYSNFDNSKLFLTPPYGSRKIIILNDDSHSFRLLRPEPNGRGNFIVPNRKNGLIYVCQLYEQFIMDLNGNYGILSYIDSRGSSSADFSYRNSEDNIIYFCNEDYLSINDYNKAEVLFWTDHIGLSDLKSSLDGKYIFMIKDKSIYQFYLELFY